MTKAELIAQIATETGVDKRTISSVVESLMDCVKADMKNGENIYLRGFGSFIVKRRAQKLARNIKNKTSVIVPAHNIPAFKPAKEFMNDLK